MTQATRLNSQIEEIQKKIAQLQEQLKQKQQKKRGTERKQDTKRKILLGALLQSWMEQGVVSEQKIQEGLDSFLSRDSDRVLFDLPARPKPENFNNGGTQPATVANTNTDVSSGTTTIAKTEDRNNQKGDNKIDSPQITTDDFSGAETINATMTKQENFSSANAVTTDILTPHIPQEENSLGEESSPQQPPAHESASTKKQSTNRVKTQKGNEQTKKPTETTSKSSRLHEVDKQKLKEEFDV
jgi:hypothetical protein